MGAVLVSNTSPQGLQYSHISLLLKQPNNHLTQRRFFIFLFFVVVLIRDKTE